MPADGKKEGEKGKSENGQVEKAVDRSEKLSISAGRKQKLELENK